MAEKKEPVCSVNRLWINKRQKNKVKRTGGIRSPSPPLSKRYSTINYVSTAVTPLLSLPDYLNTHTHTDAGIHTNTSSVRDSGRHSYL